MVNVTIPRVLGGTLIISIVPAQPLQYTDATWLTRDMKATDVTRDMKVPWITRDEQVNWKTRQ